MNATFPNLPLHSNVAPSPALFEVLRDRIRAKALSKRTESAYQLWTRRLLRFHPKLHPREMGEKEIGAFMRHMDDTVGFSASTQQQAWAALSFLYREVLKMDAPWLDALPKPPKPSRTPVYFTPPEVETLFANLVEKHQLAARLLYGTGMRLMECVRLRIQDVDLEAQQITLHDAEGGLDREIPLPPSLLPALDQQLRQARKIWEQDRRQNMKGVPVPPTLERDDPTLGEAWEWFWVFPSDTPATERNTGQAYRPPSHEQALQRAIRRAIAKSGIDKDATTNTLRHSFAMECLRSGRDLRTVQKLLGLGDAYAAKVYLRMLEEAGESAKP